MKTRSAVLLMVFNRPDSTAKVFQTIRAAKPPRLYIAADGPRNHRDGERALCEKTRQIATAIDWPCQVNTLFREQNMGCKLACSSAVNWFFEIEQEGIILEDDIVPSPSFFPFCDELLEKYRRDPRVGHICGMNPIHTRPSATTSYFFSIYPFVWGWAGWRRAWKLYDVEMSAWPTWAGNGGLSTVSAGSRRFERYWHSVLDATKEGRVNTWDYQWAFACWQHGMLSVIPAVNQVANVGFGPDATHTNGAPPAYARPRMVKQMEFPLNHPPRLALTPDFERAVETHVLGLTTGRELRRLLYRIPMVERLAKTLRQAIAWRQ